MERVNVNNVVLDRVKKASSFLAKKVDWLIYVLLALVVYIAVWIRTLNTPGLRDITTGGWTLGPDLDPFLFLRWAKYIVENGSLFSIDMMRYVPLGFDTGLEYPLLSNLIAIFHKVAILFGSVSVEQSAVYFPVFMFAITVVAFFLMAREAFLQTAGKRNAGYIAVVASFFLSVIPVFIPRTIAGIPEKESAAFFFLFMGFYLLIKGWNSSGKKGYILCLLGGLFAGTMGLIWGGYAYVLLILNTTILILFFLDNLTNEGKLKYVIFLFFAEIMPFTFFSERFDILSHAASVEGMTAAVTVFVLLCDFLVHGKLTRYIPNKLRPYKKLTSIIAAGIVIPLLGTIFLGHEYILNQVTNLYHQLVRPATSRLIQTVAENRQPFFVEWARNFGPYFGSIPILLVIFFGSALTLIFNSLKNSEISRKHKMIILSSFAFFTFAIVMTRYSSEGLFNGSNFISVATYFLGAILLFLSFGYVQLKNKDNKELFKKIPFGVVLIIAFFIIGVVSSRAFIRLVLMLVPPASMLIGYIFVLSINKIYRSVIRKDLFNLNSLVSISLIILIIFSGYYHLQGSKELSRNYVPSSYTQQWQKAMQWVRESTPTNAVFGHWWDYGYWIQTMGERATVLDGGNLLGYWNHLMGRYALTETDLSKTLEFLYSHNVTHFLIDSTDIGKYSAFSTIGSDATYDRTSWIPTLIRDNAQTTQKKNSTVFVYPGGSMIDEDIIYDLNGTEIFLPSGKTYVAAIIVEVDSNDLISDVNAIYYFQDKTYQLPLRYYWDQKVGLVDRGEGIFGGAFFFPKVNLNNQGGGDIEPRGAALYLSPRTVMSNVARFYLYGAESNSFKLAHSEPDQFVELLKSQNVIQGDFVFLNEFRGPIKIWELNYPSDMKVNQDFLQTEYPEEILYG